MHGDCEQGGDHVKEARSVTMNIFRKKEYCLIKSFVKTE